MLIEGKKQPKGGIMIFKFHTAFTLGLIALVAGTYLVARMRSENMCCRGFGKFVGWVVIIAAFLSLVCTTYHGVTYWKASGYKFGKMWHGKGMQQKCPLMEKMKMEEPGETE